MTLLDQTLFIISLFEGGFSKCRVRKHRRIPALVALSDFAFIGQFEITQAPSNTSMRKAKGINVISAALIASPEESAKLWYQSYR